MFSDGDTGLEQPFAVLFEDSLRRLDQVRRELGELEETYSRSVEYRGHRAFIEALQIVAYGLRQRILQHKQSFLDKEDPAHRRSTYISLGTNAVAIGEHLEIHLSDLAAQRPQELEVFTVPFTRLAKSVIDNVEILFVPWAFDGYEARAFGPEQFELLDIDADNLRQTFGSDILFLKLLHPATRERDIFHHAVFAHELGHAAIQQPIPWKHLRHEDRPPEGEDPSTYETIGFDFLDRPEGIQRDREQQLLLWFRELACDVFAMRLIGPAFAIAFTEVTSPNRTLEPVERSQAEHPPPHIRFRFLEEEVDNFFPEDSAERQLLCAYTKTYQSFASEQEEEIEGAEEWLGKALGKFRAYLPHLLGDAEYKPEVLETDLDLVCVLAQREIPPAERILPVEAAYSPGPDDEWSAPIDWRSILNGVLIWHCKQTGSPALERSPAPRASGSDGDNRRRDFVRLAAGGIELSEFHTRASTLRRQYDHMRLDSELGRRVAQ